MQGYRDDKWSIAFTNDECYVLKLSVCINECIYMNRNKYAALKSE